MTWPFGTPTKRDPKDKAVIVPPIKIPTVPAQQRPAHPPPAKEPTK